MGALIEPIVHYKRTNKENFLKINIEISEFNGEIELAQMLLHIIMGDDKMKVITSVGQYAIKNLQGCQGNKK